MSFSKSIRHWRQMTIRAMSLVLLSGMPATHVVADEFDLFDPTRGMPKETPTPPPRPPAPPPPPPPVQKKEPAKNFILRGTSRIGDRYRVYLQAPDQKEIRLDWREGERNRIEGFPGYELHRVKPRTVGMRYPLELPCLSDEGIGVECFGIDGLTWLSMQRRAPTPPKQPLQPATSNQEQATSAGQQPDGQGENDKNKPINPFLQAINRAKERASEKLAETGNPNVKPNSAFQPKRIDEKDVPPGMRVVHTPFGDRLVPAR
jgi:hypothetical protein